MKKLECKKCGYRWIARIEKPKTCPKCKCRAWENYKPKGEK